MNFSNWVLNLSHEKISTNYIEQIRASIGACLGVLLTGFLTYSIEESHSITPFLIAPIGASAFLLFVAPTSSLAKPWSVLGGNMVGALIGITCIVWIHNILLAASLAVGVTIIAMFLLRCLHPPGVAVALLIVLGGGAIHSHNYSFVIFPVGVNSLLLLFAAILYNNLTNRLCLYFRLKGKVVQQNNTNLPEKKYGFSFDDLVMLLKKSNHVVDLSGEDFMHEFKHSEIKTYHRCFDEISTLDVMSNEVVCVEFGTELQEAWMLLRKSKVKALPVINRSKRVIGIVSEVNFIKNANLDLHDSIGVKLEDMICKTPSLYSNKPEVVGQIMTYPAVTANVNMKVAEILSLMQLPNVCQHIPVIDDNSMVVGILSQSDLLRAIHQSK